jgi:hypothetical protein
MKENKAELSGHETPLQASAAVSTSSAIFVPAERGCRPALWNA